MLAVYFLLLLHWHQGLPVSNVGVPTSSPRYYSKTYRLAIFCTYLLLRRKESYLSNMAFHLDA